MIASFVADYFLPVVAGTLLMALLLVFIIYFIFLYRKSQEKLLLEQEQLKQALLRAEIEIKEQTLDDISKELHDNYGQVVSLIKINLGLLSNQNPEKQRQTLSETSQIVKQLLVDIKSLAGSLNGERIRNLGWVEMIKNELDRINRMGFLYINQNFPNQEVRLEHEKKVILYRVIQELINNTLKHAEAHKAILDISIAGKMLIIKFIDYGKGFKTSSSLYKGGAGIFNIKSRCNLIGANFDMESEINKGTSVKISLKMNEDD